MNTAIVKEDRFQIVNNQPMTTTKHVADVFGKNHSHVIRTVESLQVPDTWYKSNFGLIQIKTDLGLNRTRNDKAYRMTKDGFVFLVMGFTGKKAAAFKIAYIEAFNRMQKEFEERAMIQPLLSTNSTPSRLVYKGETVVTGSFLAYMLGLDRGTLTYRKNSEDISFKEGVHFYKLTHKEVLKLCKNPIPLFMPISKSAKGLVVWTEKGVHEHYKRLSANSCTTRHRVKNFMDEYFSQDIVKQQNNKVYSYPADSCSLFTIEHFFNPEMRKYSAMEKLFSEMKTDGHNVEAAVTELQTMYEVIKRTGNFLYKVKKAFSDNKNFIKILEA